MANRLLLADGDAKNLRVLDVSLRAAGFEVRTATNGTAAWSAIEAEAPDLIIADADLPELDGFELCARVRGRDVTAGIPFIFLGSDNLIAHRIKGIEVGADDYLTKPAFVQEVVTRVRSAVQRRAREKATTGAPSSDVFKGLLSDISVVDLLGIVESSGRSGIVHLRGTRDAPGTLYFRQGQVVDAEVGRLSGVDAIGRLFTWTTGSFEVEWKSIRRPNAVGLSTADLVLEGMKRLDDRNHLAAGIGDLQKAFEVNYPVLAERLAEIPDEVNGILRLFDGARSLAHVIEDSHLPDLEAMALVTRLRDEGIIHDPADAGSGRSSPGPLAPDQATAASGRTSSLGAGSGPVQQSFANRQLTEAAPETVAPGDEPDDALPPPSRSKTDPGLGKPLGQPEIDEALQSLDEALVEREGIPEPRHLDANVIPFPVGRDATESGPIDLAATQPLGRVSDIQRRLTEPMASLALVPSPTEESPAATDGAVPTPADSSRLHTQRGIGPFPNLGDFQRVSPPESTDEAGPAAEAIAAAALHPPAPAAPPAAIPDPPPASDAVAARSAVILPPPPPPPPPEAPPRAAVSSLGANETVRINFPDADISERDALDELGVPSSRRGARLLAAALAVGAVAAVLVHRLRTAAFIAKPAAVFAPAAGRSGPAAPPDEQPAASAGIAPAPVAPAPAAPAPVAMAEAPGRTAPSGAPVPAAPAPAPGAAAADDQRRAAREPTAGAPAPVGVLADPASAPNALAAAVPPSAPEPQPRPDPDPRPVADKAPTDPIAAAPVPAPRGSPPSPADFAHQLADCRSQFLRNRIRDAATSCAAAAASNPGSADALTMLAHVELNRGRLKRANDLAEKSISLDPNQADAYVIIGGVHQDSGRSEEAKTAYQRYLQLAPHGRYADELRSIVGSL